MREAEKRGIKELGKTSQAAPKSFLDAFKKQLKKFDKVLCITVTSKVSGTYNSALQAKQMLKDPSRVFVFDSLTATAGEALIILRAIELIQEKREIEEIIEELRKLTPRIKVYILIEDPKWIEATGRITSSQANWIRRMTKLRIRPMLQIKEGKITKGGVSLFDKNIPEALLKRIEKESRKFRKKGKRIRVIITHADNPEGAEKLKKMLKENIKEVDIPFLKLVCTLIGSRLGPGSIVAGWHPM